MLFAWEQRYHSGDKYVPLSQNVVLLRSTKHVFLEVAFSTVSTKKMFLCFHEECFFFLRNSIFRPTTSQTIGIGPPLTSKREEMGRQTKGGKVRQPLPLLLGREAISQKALLPRKLLFPCVFVNLLLRENVFHIIEAKQSRQTCFSCKAHRPAPKNNKKHQRDDSDDAFWLRPVVIPFLYRQRERERRVAPRQEKRRGADGRGGGVFLHIYRNLIVIRPLQLIYRISYSTPA